MDKDFLNTDLRGKTVVFTGGTDGMGKEAVMKIAEMGATIMLLGRNEKKSLAVVKELNGLAQKNNTSYVPCDLASLASIRDAAGVVLERCPRIDVVINCAGALFGKRKYTEEGHEMTWAVNHLAPFMLNSLLLERLKENENAKIVNISSATEKSGHIHFDNIDLGKQWSTLKSYAQSKLAMNMLTRKMAKELKGTGVSVNALHPGFIKTHLLRELRGIKRFIGIPYMLLFASKPEVGVHRILKLAFSEDFDGVSGAYVYEDGVKDPNPEALNEAIVDRVWRLSKQQVGL